MHKAMEPTQQAAPMQKDMKGGYEGSGADGERDPADAEGNAAGRGEGAECSDGADAGADGEWEEVHGRGERGPLRRPGLWERNGNSGGVAAHREAGEPIMGGDGGRARTIGLRCGVLVGKKSGTCWWQPRRGCSGAAFSGRRTVCCAVLVSEWKLQAALRFPFSDIQGVAVA